MEVSPWASNWAAPHQLPKETLAQLPAQVGFFSPMVVIFKGLLFFFFILKEQQGPWVPKTVINP
jgi:hypothetical protein